MATVPPDSIFFTDSRCHSGECPADPLGLRISSRATLSSTQNMPLPDLPGPPTGWRGPLRPGWSEALELMRSGHFHDFRVPPGLSVDYSRLISFHDPEYSSLAAARSKIGDRTQYRLNEISPIDVAKFRKTLHAALTMNTHRATVNWDRVFRTVITTYDTPLALLRALLRPYADVKTPASKAFDEDRSTQAIDHVRGQLMVIMGNFIDRNAIPSFPVPGNSTWLGSTIASCSTLHTAHVSGPALTASDVLLKKAVDRVTQEICRTMALLWTEALPAQMIATRALRYRKLHAWHLEVDRLMTWLGWARWTTCEPACGIDSFCTLPQWPFHDDLQDKTPRCVSRLEEGTW